MCYVIKALKKQSRPTIILHGAYKLNHNGPRYENAN